MHISVGDISLVDMILFMISVTFCCMAATLILIYVYNRMKR